MPSSSRVRYVCESCGREYGRWQGYCHHCGASESLKEKDARQDSVAGFGRLVGSSQKSRTKAYPQQAPAGSEWVSLSCHQDSGQPPARLKTGIAECDRVCGGGLVKGGVVLVGGDPGIGKSTLMLQLADAMAQKYKTAYISGEETVEQLKARGQRLGCQGAMILAHETCVETIIERLISIDDLAVLVLDSVQSFYVAELDSLSGSVVQLRSVASVFIDFARRRGVSVLLVGHVTKEGHLAGPKLLEHMVDTVLYFEHDFKERFRLLRARKNRYGATEELGIFEMRADGLHAVTDPSCLFLSDYHDGMAGSALFPSLEGGRSILLEVQALIVRTSFGLPRRSAIGFDLGRLLMLLAVLEARCGMSFATDDIYVNVVGGIKLRDSGGDLAVVAALLSAKTQRPLPKGSIFCGEIGLAGEMRSVPRIDMRIEDAEKRGYQKAFIPKTTQTQKQTKRNKDKRNMTLFTLSHLKNMLDMIVFTDNNNGAQSASSEPTPFQGKRA